MLHSVYHNLKKTTTKKDLCELRFNDNIIAVAIYAWQLGKVLNRLNAQQSENYIEFLQSALS